MILLVDKNDTPLGTMPKLEAHEEGLLHRAFSVFIINSLGEILLQRRAFHKYHSPGKWTNTCCSHPAPEETVEEAAMRRLREEMGLETELDYLFKFHYKADLNNGLTENEIDHVFFGQCDLLPAINEEEVCEFRYMNIFDIYKEMQSRPEDYTIWFRLIMDHFMPEIYLLEKNK